MKQRDYGLDVQVGLAIFGFFLVGVLSLAAGNSVWTSLERSAVGLFGLFLVGYLLRQFLRMFVAKPSQPEELELRGNHIDLLLTAEQKQATNDETVEDDFVPLVETVKQSREQFLQHQDPRLIADALRHFDE